MLWGLTPFPAAGNLAWPGRTERRSWADLLFDTYTRWPCGTLPPDRALRRLRPGAARRQGSRAPLSPRSGIRRGRVLRTGRTPRAVTRSRPDRRVRPGAARDRQRVVGRREGPLPAAGPHHVPGRGRRGRRTSGPVEDGLTTWGVSIDLAPSVHARGRVEHNNDLTFMFVLAFMDDVPVSAVAANGPDFEIAADPKPAFNRLIVRLQPRGRNHPGPGVHHLLSRFCYTTVGALSTRKKRSSSGCSGTTCSARSRSTSPRPRPAVRRTSGARAAGHLPHRARHAHGERRGPRPPWTDHGVATELLVVATGGAPPT